MPLKTPEQYVESLRELKIRAYVGGERVESIVEHPSIAPHINTVGEDLRAGASARTPRRDDRREPSHRASGSTATRTSSRTPTTW